MQAPQPQQLLFAVPPPPPPPPPQPPMQAPQQPQQAQQLPSLAPPAHGALPAEGPPHDYRTKTAALAFLCDVKAAFDTGVLTLNEFQQQRAKAMADLDME
jgi:hypothetical protein